MVEPAEESMETAESILQTPDEKSSWQRCFLFSSTRLYILAFTSCEPLFIKNILGKDQYLYCIFIC